MLRPSLLQRLPIHHTLARRYTTMSYPVNPKYTKHAEIATQAVLRAAYITTKVQAGIVKNQDKKGGDVEEKVDKSPVTGQ